MISFVIGTGAGKPAAFAGAFPAGKRFCQGDDFVVKKTCTFFMCLFLMLSMFGCAESEPAQDNVAQSSVTPSGTQFPYTFTDSVGNTVTIEREPENVAVLFSSYGEVWQLAGGEISVTVGDTVERGFARQDTPLVDDGAGLKIDVELLASYEPDFVIGSADMSAQVDACQYLAEAGIPCALFEEESFDDYLSMLKIFTDITGDSEAYDEYGIQVQTRVEDAVREAKKLASDEAQPVSVLFIRAGTGGSSTKAKTAADHFVGKMLEKIGTVNIADEAGALSEGLSLEHIVTNQPDVILIVTQGDEEAAVAYMESVFEESGWRDLEAVKNGRCVYLPKELFHYKPNARWDQAYRYLTEAIYSAGETGNE